MDPLTITISVVTLIKVAGQASILLRQFCIDLGGINVILTGLQTDVAGFQQVLESMHETFEKDDIKANLTGHTGNHWKNLARCLKDGEETLHQLNNLLESVNKTTKFLDGPRKLARFKGAVEQIGMFREQIQSYQATLKLSLSTIILYNQVNFQNSNQKILELIAPSLDKLFDEIRDVAKSLNAKIEKLQNKDKIQNNDQKLNNGKEQNTEASRQLSSLKNLRECVRSAADVASTASSTLTADMTRDDKGSVKYGSDLGDVFPNEPNDMMLDWISASTIYEEDASPGTIHAPPGEDSDSDSDIEIIMIQALFDSANQLKEDGDFASAESKLRNCLSLSSEKSAREDVVGRHEILEALVDTYWMMESWEKAKTSMAEKMSITERQHGKKDEAYSWDTLKLAMLMMKCEEYVEAQLQGRRALQGFRRLKEPGFLGYEKSLLFLVELCSIRGRHDEQDAYATLLASHQAKQNATSVSVEMAVPTPSKTPNKVAPVVEPDNEPLESLFNKLNESSKRIQEQAAKFDGQQSVPPDPAPPIDLPIRRSNLEKIYEKPVFGVRLDDLFRRDYSPVPFVVYQCIKAVDLFGLDVPGIYRMPGTESRIQQMKALFNSDSAQVDFGNPEAFQHDIASVSGLLKHFFLELPEPLLTSASYPQLIDAARVDDDRNRRDSMHAIINALPDTNYASLRVLMLHLNRVKNASNINHMDTTQIAIFWRVPIFGRQNENKSGEGTLQLRIIVTILNNVLEIFDED